MKTLTKRLIEEWNIDDGYSEINEDLDFLITVRDCFKNKYEDRLEAFDYYFLKMLRTSLRNEVERFAQMSYLDFIRINIRDYFSEED